MHRLPWIILSFLNSVAFLAISGFANYLGDPNEMVQSEIGLIFPPTHWMFTAIAYASIAGVVAGICQNAVRSTSGKRMASVMVITIAVLCLLLVSPEGLGVWDLMTGNAYTASILIIVMAIIAIIIAIFQIIFARDPSEQKYDQE